ncbi:MAG: hypothetical protein ABIY38_08595 [Rhodococcus sp. (in: high G+C Gram-positive bacteria)]
MATTYSAVGHRTKRLDSPPKLIGAEQFTADLRIHGMLRSAIVGSTYAHARIVSVNKDAALAVPGVVAVLTNADLKVRLDEEGNPAVQLLAGDEALHSGHPVAIVLAETDAAAQDGAELVEIEYEELPVVVDLDAAILPDAPLVSHGKSGAFDDEAAMHNADAATGAGDDEDLPPNVSSSVNYLRGDIAQ